MSYTLNTGYPSRQIYIQSGDADHIIDGIGDRVYYFSEILHVPTHITMLMSIVDAQIPMSYYAINTTNYTLNYTESGADKTYQLTAGNTDAITLKNDLTTNLDNITCTYSTITNKFTFTDSSGDFTFKASSTALKLLGFTPDTAHTSSSSVLTSNNCVDLSGTKAIYLQTQLGNYNIDSRTGQNTSVLTKIPVDTGGNGILKYTNKTNYKSAITAKHIGHLHIQLEDDNRNIIDFNGVNYSITFQLDFIETIPYKHYNKDFQMLEATNLSDIIPRPKPRGRPKGSKNKPKEEMN